MFQTLVILLFSLSSYSSELTCEQAHKKALSQCESHKHMMASGLLNNINQKTKVRVAQKEADKLFSSGKLCAKKQQLCLDICSQSLANTAESSGDVTQVIDLQSDCSEGQIAKHRSEFAKKYLIMKETLDKARKPSSKR